MGGHKSTSIGNVQQFGLFMIIVPIFKFCSILVQILIGIYLSYIYLFSINMFTYVFKNCRKKFKNVLLNYEILLNLPRLYVKSLCFVHFQCKYLHLCPCPFVCLLGSERYRAQHIGIYIISHIGQNCFYRIFIFSANVPGKH